MSESNDTVHRNVVTSQQELNQINEISSERRVNRPLNRDSQLKSLILPRNEIPYLSTDPYKKEGRSLSLSNGKSLNNYQLIRWITNATKEVKSSMKNEKNEKVIEKLEKEFELNLARLILVQVKQSEINQEMIKQIQNELESIKQELCELSSLFQTWQMLTDKKFQEIIELSEKHENEIDYLKMLYQNKFDDLQQQLDQSKSSSAKITNKETTLLSKTKTIFKRKTIRESSEKFEGMQPNLTSDIQLSISNQVPSLSWEITRINHKIQNHQEIWSKYFQTPDKKFTMRLWIHFPGIPNKSSMNIELLVWNNSRSMSDEFIYEEDITIIISNKMMPYCFESISKRIRIDETSYSSVINVKYSNLKKNKVLNGDTIIIKCLIGYK